MKALGATFAVLLATGAASAQVGPPANPGVPHDYPYPGQYPGEPGYPMSPPQIGQPPDVARQERSDVRSPATEALRAHVVSVDPKGRTITVRELGTGHHSTMTANGTSADVTLHVDRRAASALKTVKAGDAVRLSYRTDDSGNRTVEKIERLSSQER